ncbi:hypothetical protein GCM10009623_26860 [Nocardioides aestuarii]
MAGLVITALLLGGVVLLSPGDEFATTRRLLGVGGERHAEPPDFTPGQGSFRFLRTQRGSQQPVAWDPCEPIRYVVNPQGAPDGWPALIDEAVADVEWATGLDLVDLGTSDARPFAPTYGAVARPVVIGFADETEIADLAGDTAGVGGSIAQTGVLDRDYYVSGSVALDTAVFDDARVESQFESMRAIVQHELGHVLGLDHVDDPGELMFGSNLGRTGWGRGDLEGLARLGSVPCR